MDKSISMKIFIILICITAFFSNAIGNGYYMLILCLVPVCIKFINLLPRIKINSSIPLMLFIGFSYISSTFSASKEDSNKFIFVMIIYLIVKLVLEDNFGWQRFFSKILFFITAISVAATFLSVVAPDMMLSIANMLYSGEAFDTYSKLFYNSSYAGLYGQTAINGYVISIFLAFAIVPLFSEKRAKLNYVLLGIGIIALLLTQKRSLILANIIATLVFFMVNSKSDKKKLKQIGRLLFLVIVVFLVIQNSQATQGIIDKMSLLESSGDITNGREALWTDTFEIWKKNPIFGVGINSMNSVYGLSTHNAYIQLLAEVGIFGVISYIIFLWTSFKRSEKAYQYILNDDTLINRSIYGVAVYMQAVLIVYSFFDNIVYNINCMLLYILFVSAIDSYQKYRYRKM